MISGKQYVVSIVEDQPDVGKALKDFININTSFCCDNVYPSGEEAMAGIPSCQPDIVIMDIGLPGISGIECVKRIRKNDQTTLIIMFTVFDTEEQLFDALRSGANGYILKDTPVDDIPDLLKEAIEGGAPMSPPIAKKVLNSFHNKEHKKQHKLESLTEHQMHILKLITKGFLNKEIADKLSIKEGTVKVQVSRIYKKLHVNNRIEASNLYKGSG